MNWPFGTKARPATDSRQRDARLGSRGVQRDSESRANKATQAATWTKSAQNRRWQSMDTGIRLSRMTSPDLPCSRGGRPPSVINLKEPEEPAGSLASQWCRRAMLQYLNGGAAGAYLCAPECWALLCWWLRPSLLARLFNGTGSQGVRRQTVPATPTAIGGAQARRRYCAHSMTSQQSVRS